MAFMGRGGFPSIKNTGGVKGGGGYYRSFGFHSRIHYYIPITNTYIAIQIILSLIIVVVMAITLFFTHKPTIIDPIESVKTSFINSYLIILGVLLFATFLSNSFAKSEKALIKLLIGILVISIMSMLIFFIQKVDYDKTYTYNKFRQIYTGQSTGKNSNARVDIGLSGMSIKPSSEYYVDECMELYRYFSIKVYAIIVLHAFINLLLIYQLVKLLKIQSKRNKMEKDDLILFDEEQNIKI